MNIDFQDRIDEYVLGRMSDEDKLRFESEVAQDEGKKEQLELTRNVKTAISSRQEKLAALARMKDRYDEEHHVAAIALRPTATDACRPCRATPEHAKATKPSSKKIWLWASGIAAVLIVGFFVVTPFMHDADSPAEIQRGDDEMFCPEYNAAPADACPKDTVTEEDDDFETSEPYE